MGGIFIYNGYDHLKAIDQESWWSDLGSFCRRQSLVVFPFFSSTALPYFGIYPNSLEAWCSGVPNCVIEPQVD